MSTPTDPDPTPQDDTTSGAAPDVQDDNVDQADTPEKDHEAAKYRRRLRDTEIERDALASRLETMQRAEAERLAASTLADGRDLWLGGTTLPDLLDDDGVLDTEKVTQAAQLVSSDRPHWRRTTAAAAPAATVTADGKIGDQPATRSWSQLLRGDDPGGTSD